MPAIYDGKPYYIFYGFMVAPDKSSVSVTGEFWTQDEVDTHLVIKRLEHSGATLHGATVHMRTGYDRDGEREIVERFGKGGAWWEDKFVDN